MMFKEDVEVWGKFNHGSLVANRMKIESLCAHNFLIRIAMIENNSTFFSTNSLWLIKVLDKGILDTHGIMKGAK